MKNIILVLVLTFGILANATCIQMLNEKDILNKFIKINYCDKNTINIELKNRNKYFSNFSENMTLNQFENLINAYKKTLKWFDKAKDLKINIEKRIYLNRSKNFIINFDSSHNGKRILVLLIGAKSRVEGGAFGIGEKYKLESFISKLENIRDNGAARFKKESDIFK